MIAFIDTCSMQIFFSNLYILCLITRILKLVIILIFNCLKYKNQYLRLLYDFINP